MGSRSIIPMIVVELELDTVEVLKRGLVDKMKPNKLENTQEHNKLCHINSESCLKPQSSQRNNKMFPVPPFSSYCRPYLKHDSSEILHIRNSCYKQEVEHVRQHFQQQYKNWIVLNGLKSKWCIWDSILKEVSISMKYIHSYLDRTRSGKFLKSRS